MRSFSLKAATAAIILSTSLAGAYAASPGAYRLDSLQTQTMQNHGATPDEIDAMPTASTVKPMAGMTAPRPAVLHKAAYRPRLAHIVGEVGAANHRIHVDHSRGFLTRAEAAMFQQRAHAIRADAVRVAELHRGALPKARFAAFQLRVDRLDRAIHHAATT